MSACEVSMEEMDKDFGVPKEGVPKEGKFNHDVRHLDVDLDTLTDGAINWDKAILSLQWMVDKASEALKEHDTKEISQFLAKTCIMHTIQCFHHCRDDKAPGYAHAEERIQTQPPSEKV